MERLLDDSGKLLVLGNEAIVRGCIEAGVAFASTYPGTPSSEIGNTLQKIGQKAGVYFEFSTNEKVALEAAAAAAISGVRSFAFMKHVGVNVAADPLMTLAYSGVDGGMVILTADDPSCHSSQNEQDNRYYSTLSHLPMFEPATPAEAKEMIKEAFKVSEELKSPVLFRTTTRVNHARGMIELSKPEQEPAKGKFVKDACRFVNIPAFARMNRLKLLERSEAARRVSESSPYNTIEGEGQVGIITSGVSYTYAKEWMEDVSILKLGMSSPLPEDLVARFIRDKDMVIIVEELEPYLEDQVLRVARQNGISTPIFGKRTGHLPRAFEYNPDVISNIGIVPVREGREPLSPPPMTLPTRPPMLCAGCPHRATFYALKKAVGKEGAIYSSDIGCYTLGIQPPFETADLVMCMGGSVGAAGGFSAVTDQRVVDIIGDSTFFHTGVPPLMNATFNGHKFVLVIVDNRATAMTGHQPHPGTGRNHGGRDTPALAIEPLVKACGVEHVVTVDPLDVKTTQKAIKGAMEHDGISVIVSQSPCPLELKKRRALQVSTYAVDQDKCVKCYHCVEALACTAFYRDGENVMIDPDLCIGCGVCAKICPRGAMGVVE